MKKFWYVAKASSGAVCRGLAEAADRNALSQTLYEEGRYLMMSCPVPRPGRMKQVVLAELFRNISGLLRSGMRVDAALELMAKEQQIGAWALCAALRDKVRQGYALSEAMEATASFPPLVIGMVRSGEENGALSERLTRLAEHFEAQHRMEQEVRSALTYPALLSLMILGSVVAIFVWLMPQFEDLFAGMETLPLITRVLMALSRYLVKRWYMIPLSLLAACVGLCVLKRWKGAGLRIEGWKLEVPLLGNLFKQLYTARLARSLASLWGCGVPLEKIFDLSIGATGSQYLQAQLPWVTKALRQGESLSQALGRLYGISPKLLGAMFLAESSGEMDGPLFRLAETLEEDTRQSAKRMLALLEPCLMIIMAAVIGLIAIGMMVPLVRSYGVLETL